MQNGRTPEKPKAHPTHGGHALRSLPASAAGLPSPGCVLSRHPATWVTRASWVPALGTRTHVCRNACLHAWGGGGGIHMGIREESSAFLLERRQGACDQLPPVLGWPLCFFCLGHAFPCLGLRVLLTRVRQRGGHCPQWCHE